MPGSGPPPPKGEFPTFFFFFYWSWGFFKKKPPPRPSFVFENTRDLKNIFFKIASNHFSIKAIGLHSVSRFQNGITLGYRKYFFQKYFQKYFSKNISKKYF